MKVFKTKSVALAGTNYKEISKKAFALYNGIRRKTKRRPYVRSAYFKKDKIFLPLFWNHLREKSFRDRTRRLKFFHCAIELIEYSRHAPETIQTIERPFELLHRFAGETKEGKLFLVQIKQEKSTGEKWLTSVFPEN